VRVATTSDASPVSGTVDWTPVAMKVEAPKETDFVVLRCILKGSGTAWFDDLHVVDAGADAGGEMPSGGADSARDHPVPPDKGEVARLVPETESVSESVESLRKGNQALLEELGQLRTQIEALREQLKAIAASRPGAPRGFRRWCRTDMLSRRPTDGIGLDNRDIGGCRHRSGGLHLVCL
jgi:hypothetical protein